MGTLPLITNQCSESSPRLSFAFSREERESWIRAKYKQKLFVAPLAPPTPGEGPDITLSGRLLLAAMERNLPKLLLLLAHCSKEEVNGPLSRALSSRSLFALRLPGSALHAACQQGDVVMTQLLLWVGEMFLQHNTSTTSSTNRALKKKKTHFNLGKISTFRSVLEVCWMNGGWSCIHAFPQKRPSAVQGPLLSGECGLECGIVHELAYISQ